MKKNGEIVCKYTWERCPFATKQISKKDIVDATTQIDDMIKLIKNSNNLD